MAKSQVAQKDFFGSCTRMTLSEVSNFFKNVYLKMDPKIAPPVMLWGPAGIAKSSIVEEVFGKTDKGLTTVILSQIGALDSNGLPHINEKGSTIFSPTETFGRGKKHLFLDELNNAAPSTMACVQNLLSAKAIGGDKYDEVFIIAACNPPSTNSLANDLNHPTMSRCLHIMVEYSIDDFLNFALNTGKIHPAVAAFHKKTGGSFLQAKWGVGGSSQYVLPEPGANEPYPCPRSWTLASAFMFAMEHGKASGSIVDYTLMKPLVEGCVGVAAASEFATTYAFMNKIPDVAKVFTGELVKFSMPKDEIAVQYITMQASINHAIGRLAKAENDKITASISLPSKTSPLGSDAYQLVSGIHRTVVFIGETCSSELVVNYLTSVTSKLRESKLSSLLGTLLNGVDPKAGLDRDSIAKYSRRTCISDKTVSESIG